MTVAANAMHRTRLHVLSAGAGPSVLCLHSSGSSSSQWRRLIETAAGEFAFHAFDLFGHGRSPAFAGDVYTLSSEADAVLDSLPPGQEPAHLVGHSYGGAAAIDIALRFPARFASVTVFEPVLFGLLPRGSTEFDEITSVGFGIARAARAGDAEAASSRFIDYWNGAGAWRAMPPEHRERVRVRIAAIARHFPALFANPLPLDALRALRVPTRILCGTGSPPPARAVCERLAALDAVTLERLPGVAHMGPLTHADRVNASIVRHLTDQRALRLAA